MTPNLSFALLLGGMGAFATGRILGPGKDLPWQKTGALLTGLAWAALTACLILRWSRFGHAPMSNQYESMLLLTWCFLGLLLLFGHHFPVGNPGIWTSLAALFLLGTASLLDRSVRPLMPALQSNWLILHVLVCMAAYACFFLSFLAAAACLLPAASPAKSEATLDAFAYRTVSLGFVLLTLGIVFGAVWANEAWGTYWSWDPKETWSLITWLAYAVALHLRRARGWRGRRFAVANAASFGCVAFTYFGVNYLLAGLHAYV